MRLITIVLVTWLIFSTPFPSYPAYLPLFYRSLFNLFGSKPYLTHLKLLTFPIFNTPAKKTFKESMMSKRTITMLKITAIVVLSMLEPIDALLHNKQPQDHTVEELPSTEVSKRNLTVT